MHSRPRYQDFLFDSARWDDFAFRPGDIVISTPPKCGTTWTQMLCALLIFQDPCLPQPLAQLSPWLDMLTRTREEVFAHLAAQTHRRFIKTHTPLDGLPLQEQVSYIAVGRDPRDVSISMFYHISNIDAEVFAQALQEVNLAEGHQPHSPPAALPPTPEAFFWHWVEDETPATQTTSSLLSTLHHFESAWNLRDQPNVIRLHYNDLKADCQGEMRRLAQRLEIQVPERKWPELVQAASFKSMQAHAEELAPNSDQHFWKETRRFFRNGTGGYWREFFHDSAQKRYEARVSALASPEVVEWAHQGRHSSLS